MGRCLDDRVKQLEVTRRETELAEDIAAQPELGDYQESNHYQVRQLRLSVTGRAAWQETYRSDEICHAAWTKCLCAVKKAGTMSVSCVVCSIDGEQPTSPSPAKL